MIDILAGKMMVNNKIIKKDEDGFRPYFIVLICFIVALFSAYVISNFERKRMQKDSFEGERSLISNNIPITAISAGVGIVEGLIISFLSGYFMNLEKNQFIIWIGLITIIVLAILMTATYLLRQIKILLLFLMCQTFDIHLLQRLNFPLIDRQAACSTPLKNRCFRIAFG